MAETPKPKYVNPSTDQLLCPLNNFQDCVKERCFLWMSPEEAGRLCEAAFGKPSMPELWVPTCALLLLRQLAEPVAGSVETIEHAAHAIFVGLFEEPIPQSQTPPTELALHRKLKEISEKLDDLLKRTEKP